MKSLTELHDRFITESNVSYLDTPISPKHAEVPVIAVDKWHIEGDPKTLTKRFIFQNNKHRVEFICGLLEYESETQHHASLTINEDSVIVALITKTIEQITELDREYSRFTDQLYKDIVYSVE